MSGADSGTETTALDEATAAAEAQPNEPVEKGATGCPTSPPPAVCPTDFIVEAPDRILQAEGAAMSIKASDPPGTTGAVFTWKTASMNLRISSNRGRSILVWGLKKVSAARDAETIEVTRTGHGCSPITKTVKLTVARVLFSPSTDQRYGYDDFDNPAPWTPAKKNLHFLSVKENDHTWVRVTIEGGLLGTDFTLDRLSGPRGAFLFGPMKAEAVFDLLLRGVEAQRLQLLRVKSKQPSEAVFAELGVCVYKEKLVRVVIGKFAPPAGKGTLKYAGADYAAHQSAANGKLREGVVKYELHNLFTDNKAAEVSFLSGTDTLTFDIAKGGGPDVDALKRIMSGRTKTASPLTPNTASMTRVAVVRRMESYYYLQADAKAKDTVLNVGSGHFFSPGQKQTLGSGASAEQVAITAVDRSKGTITCGPLKSAHAKGTRIDYPAGAWSSDPIIIQEGNATETVAKWTILHEVGHRALSLFDVDDLTNFMNGHQGNSDNRLRYCPRTNYRDVNLKENQWERIPRG